MDDAVGGRCGGATGDARADATDDEHADDEHADDEHADDARADATDAHATDERAQAGASGGADPGFGAADRRAEAVRGGDR